MHLSMDIDIDMANRDDILNVIPHIPASNIKNAEPSNEVIKHPVGVYFQDIPHDPETGFSSIPYKTAEDLGYMKFDFLNVHVYKGVRDPDHLDELMNQEPLWELLEHKEFIEEQELFHLKDHADKVIKLKPKTVEQLAAVLGIIRPAKKHLLDRDWSDILKEVWIDPGDDQSFFKKSHSIAYALVIVVQMNLIIEGLNNV